MHKPLLIGSGNQGKVSELREILVGLPWTIQGLKEYPLVDEPVEDGDTFEANALKKARYYVEKFSVACISDDSGLVVDALGGAPGVYSARYAGEAGDAQKNMAKLLDELGDLPWHERTARFMCCAALALPDGTAHVEFGTVEGHIAFAPFGTLGFGYDPLFVPAGYDKTFAQIPSEEKHAISHRGESFAKMRTYMEQVLCG